MNWRAWLKGLFAAAIGSASNAGLAAIVDPSHFNFTPEGLMALIKMAAGGAILAVLHYLKQSPLPNGNGSPK